MNRCSNKDIQELLPAYLERSLPGREEALVEGHVAGCRSCSAELALLRTLADEPVPDPGEAFWASLPDKVHREVRQQQDAGRTDRVAPPLSWLRLPRWTWATAGFAAAGLILWISLRPEPPALSGDRPEAVVAFDEDALVPEPSAIAELSSSELASLDSWSRSELAPLREGVVELYMNGPEGTIESSLAEMNQQELTQLSSMLDSRKEDVSI